MSNNFIIKLILDDDSGTTTSFEIDNEPHQEKDLLRYPEYTKFYYSIGIGAPISAEIYEKSSSSKQPKYSFSFNVEGNQISMDDFNTVLNKHKNIYETLYYDASASTWKLLLAFKTNEDAYAMYKQLENIANVGAYHFTDPKTNTPILQIQYNVKK